MIKLGALATLSGSDLLANNDLREPFYKLTSLFEYILTAHKLYHNNQIPI